MNNPDKLKARLDLYCRDLAEVTREAVRLKIDNIVGSKAMAVQIDINNKILEIYEVYDKEGDIGITNL